MQTIHSKEEFDSIIESIGTHYFYVYTDWAAQGQIGLKKLEWLKEKYKEFNVIIIQNSDGKGYIYDWLQGHFKQVHGMGELFCVENEKLKWFYSAVQDLPESKLKEIFQLF